MRMLNMSAKWGGGARAVRGENRAHRKERNETRVHGKTKLTDAPTVDMVASSGINDDDVDTLDDAWDAARDVAEDADACDDAFDRLDDADITDEDDDDDEWRGPALLPFPPPEGGGGGAEKATPAPVLGDGLDIE